MMDWTDRHCRYFMRQLSAHVRLYTEMVTAAAILNGDRPHLLDFDQAEQPLAIQLGGSEPRELAEAARIAEEWGYDEINLNIGCPSDRVQSGRFGACLMAEPALVADCVAAMRDAVSKPVTVKTRIGVDELDSYAHLTDFVGQVAAVGCTLFIVHARKAWLQGLSPKQNREIPPLRYDVVADLKQDFPALEIVLNGGIRTRAIAVRFAREFDGVMIGREAYANPYLLAELEQEVFDPSYELPSRGAVLKKMEPYLAARLEEGIPLHRMTRHMLGLFQGQPGARRWRRYLSENACRKGAGLEVVRAAAGEVAAAAA
jgi:tRNA-dihydrouridine synthase A